MYELHVQHFESLRSEENLDVKRNKWYFITPKSYKTSKCSMYMAFLPRYGSVSGQAMLKNTWSIWPTISYNMAVKSSGMAESPFASICTMISGAQGSKNTSAPLLLPWLRLSVPWAANILVTSLPSWCDGPLALGYDPQMNVEPQHATMFLDKEGQTRILRTLVDVLLPAGQRAGNQAGIFSLWPIYTCRCGNFCVCIWDPLVGHSIMWSGRGTLVASINHMFQNYIYYIHRLGMYQNLSTFFLGPQDWHCNDMFSIYHRIIGVRVSHFWPQSCYLLDADPMIFGEPRASPDI